MTTDTILASLEEALVRDEYWRLKDGNDGRSVEQIHISAHAFLRQSIAALVDNIKAGR